MTYNITQTHFRDQYGRLLWAKPLEEEHRIYRIGETFRGESGMTEYRVEMVAIAEHVLHVNLSVIEEDVNIVEPYL